MNKLLMAAIIASTVVMVVRSFEKPSSVFTGKIVMNIYDFGCATG